MTKKKCYSIRIWLGSKIGVAVTRVNEADSVEAKAIRSIDSGLQSFSYNFFSGDRRTLYRYILFFANASRGPAADGRSSLLPCIEKYSGLYI